jgi:hypothetical protein
MDYNYVSLYCYYYVTELDSAMCRDEECLSVCITSALPHCGCCRNTEFNRTSL